MINMFAGMGRLTYDPELKSTPQGTSVLRFQIACDRNYQAKGQERQADFIDCVAWRQTAEFIHRYFHKGDLIAVEGNLQTSIYDKNGQQIKKTEVCVNNASFCGGKKSEDDKPNLSISKEESSYEEIIDDGSDDSLPWE